MFSMFERLDLQSKECAARAEVKKLARLVNRNLFIGLGELAR